MFTYVKAKNFKSLKEIEFNLNKTKNKINPLVVVYGENGSGKTNLVELFKLLQQTVLAKTVNIAMNQLPKELWEIEEGLIGQLPTSMQQIFQLTFQFQDYRMIDETEPTELEFGFQINGVDGFYNFKFTDAIIEESLYYKADKQRTYLYHLKKEPTIIRKELNHTAFLNKKYQEELYENIDKYWGKYSFLTLLMGEKKDKNKEYVKNSISENIFEVINQFLAMTVCIDKGTFRIIPDNLTKQRKLEDIQQGTIVQERIGDIRKYESVLNIFFTQAYADIKQVKYKIENQEGRLSYQLYFEKMIGGSLKSIPSTLESEGTQRILRQFDTLLGALTGETVIIDEIDNGIHDVLMKNIILSIQDEITGQLIVTTHNTLLLEVLPKEYLYILSTDYKGNKEIQSIKEYDIKVQKNHNARDLYLKGIFGGIPTTEYIDFEEIKDTLDDWKETNGEET